MITGVFNIIIFFLMLYGLFQIFDISFYSLSNQGLDYLMSDKKISIKKQINAVKGKNKENFIIQEVKKLNYILQVTNKKKQLPIIFTIACALGLLGVVIGLALNNMFIVPVLAIGFFLIPFWTIESQITTYKEELTGYIETALSIITTSYLRTENIILSIKENIEFVDESIKPYFKEFLVDTTVNPNIEFALRKLQNKLENKTFKEWIEAVIACQSNQMLKTTLTPIVRKMSDLRVVNNELDMLYERPKHYFLLMTLMEVIPIPLSVLMDSMVLFQTTIGKILLAVGVGLILFCIHCVIKTAKPLED